MSSARGRGGRGGRGQDKDRENRTLFIEVDATPQCTLSKIAGKSLKEIQAEHAALNARMQRHKLNESELLAEILRLQRDVWSSRKPLTE